MYGDGVDGFRRAVDLDVDQPGDHVVHLGDEPDGRKLERCAHDLDVVVVGGVEERQQTTPQLAGLVALVVVTDQHGVPTQPGAAETTPVRGIATSSNGSTEAGVGRGGSGLEKNGRRRYGGAVTAELLVPTGDLGKPGRPWTAITPAIARRPRSRVIAAIGYIGRTAPSVLPLVNGDCLVADVSEAAVGLGLTSPTAILTYLSRGVAVGSIEGLHAKTIVLARTAWIGSANASTTSEFRRIEAAVRLTEPSVVANLRTWIAELAAAARPMTKAVVKELQSLEPVSPMGLPSVPKRVVASIQLPATPPARLHLVALTESASRTFDRVKAANDRLERAALTVPSRGIVTELDDEVRDGDWFVTITPGERVGRLSRVSSGRPTVKGFRATWADVAVTPARPTRRQLADTVGGTELSDQILLEPGLIQQVIALFR